ncbi:unnamed protein product, partial [Ixodes hexagonus]
MPPQLRKRPAQINGLTSATCNDLWKLRKYASYISHLCPEMSTTREINAFFFTLSNRDKNEQFFAPCTQGGAGLCDITRKLCVFNEFLQTVGMELKEVGPGTLGLIPLHPGTVIDAFRCTDHRAWILLHWLLKEHRCITTLMLPWTMLPWSTLPKHPQHLLCDALRLNSEMRKLGLSGCTLSNEAFGDVVDALGTLTKLETVELCDVFPIQGSIGHLGKALQKLTALRCLTLSGVRMMSYDAALLLAALKTTPTLSLLDVEDYFLEPEGGMALAELVAQSTTLKQLCVWQAVCLKMKELEVLFSGLSSNHHLEELRLKGFALHERTVDRLARAVAKHRTLRCLEVRCYVADCDINGIPLAKLVKKNTGLRELVFAGGKSECFALFAAAISMNRTLERLFLGLSDMEVSDYEGFLRALALNESLECVTFEKVDSGSLSDLCTLLRETGTEGRVRFRAEFEDPQVLAKSIKDCTRLYHLSYAAAACVPAKCNLPSGALKELIHYDRLQELSIRLDGVAECESAACLAPFLASTKTLRDVSLTFHIDVDTTRVLLEALASNKSISRLTVKNWVFGAAEIDLLFQIIKTNDILNELHLQPSDYRGCPTLNQLPQRLQDNHSLLKVSVKQGLRYDTQMFQFAIQELMRRNLSTLHRAVQFVTGLHGRVYAEAFERVSKTLALVKEVQKTACESEDEARERVKDAQRFLDEHFFVAVGIVRDAVVCPHNGRVQFDRIGLDNWLEIRQYLKVSDIKAEPKEEEV